MVSILGIGDNVCDVYIDHKMMYPGGQALNVAVFSRMLGARAEYMGVFGTDHVAAHVQKALREADVPAPRARVEQGDNGCALVRLAEGDRVFVGSNKGGVLRLHPLSLTEEDIRYIRTFDLLHTSNNSCFDDALCALDLGNTLVSYDFSTAWRDEERAGRLCPRLDYGFMSLGGLSLEEAAGVMRRMRGFGCRAVIGTLGSKGALFDDGGGLIIQPPDTVSAIDTLGAGDSFAAALLCALAPLGRPPQTGFANRDVVQDALSGAARFAARCCLTRGAFGHGIAVTKEQIDTALDHIVRR